MYLQYLNDLEKDKRYQNWPSSVQDILRPTFPGMLRHVAKNFFHLVSSEQLFQLLDYGLENLFLKEMNIEQYL